jgi:radical SAM superfamily enzyme YgiQ (UPF0313 family)
MNEIEVNQGAKKPEKILLMLLPFWTPLIPPLGLACLKSFLEQHDYSVYTVDANIEPDFLNMYQEYFEILREDISEYKRGNFYNVGNNVLRNHLMMYINDSYDPEYENLVKLLIDKHFYTEVSSDRIRCLEQVVEKFYQRLEEYIIDLIKKQQPDIVGVSVYTGTLAPSMKAFRLIKENFPQITTIMGGGIFADQLSIGSPNFESFLEKSEHIDKIFVGEGENLVLKYLKGQLNADSKVYTLQQIENQTVDLLQLTEPDLSDFKIQYYPQIATFVSRSCPYQCSFCSETVQWGNYRKKPAKMIADELKRMSQKYNYQLFLFGDSLLNPVATELAKEMIDSNQQIYWDGYLRAEKPVCDPELTLLWRRGGFYRARLGVESGSQRVLDLMNKKITEEQIHLAIRSLAMAGIKTTTYWVIGYPGETEDDFKRTLNMIEQLKEDLYEAECNPFNFFLNGQVDSDYFAKQFEIQKLYPDKYDTQLLTQTWILNTTPSREETYDRVCRFVEFCRKLGIPNPYSMTEIAYADERWSRLHKNAVPSMMEFKYGKEPVNDYNRQLKFRTAQNRNIDDGDFLF